MSTSQSTYKISGGRVGILLIHGLCGTPAEMRFVANGLARAGYTVHCPKLAGHGGTTEEMKASTWQDWYQSAEDALFEMRKDCDVVIAGGLSTGALLGLMLAAKHPDKVQATTLFAPTLWLNGWLIPWTMRLYRIICSKRLANLFKFPDMHPHGIKCDRVREFVVSAMANGCGANGKGASQGLRNTPGGAVLEHRWLVKALKPMLAGIKQPTLIIHPREDDYAGLSNAYYLQRRLQGMVDMTVLDDSYHIVTVDKQRHVVVEQATSFIGRVVEKLALNAAKGATPLRREGAAA